MAVKVMMPKGSDTMTEGKVLKWLKNEGDAISTGDGVVEIETDKVNMEVEAMGSGILRKVLVAVDKVVPVGELLAVIAKADEDISALVSSNGTAKTEVRSQESGASTHAPAGAVGGTPPPAPSTQPSAPSAQPPVPSTQPLAPGPAAGGRLLASPLAKRMAKDMGLEIAQITGTGPNGRIIRQDVERRAATIPVPRSSATGVPMPSRTPAPAVLRRPAPALTGPDYSDEPLSSMRKVIATRLVQSKAPVPHFYLAIEVDMQRARELRESAKLLDPEMKLSYNDVILKACAAALRQNPEVNASFQGESIRYHHRINLGMAVATDGGGLITPVIRNADTKSLAEISIESKELAGRARTRKLLPDEYSGSTFSISNLGMMGIDEFSAVINPPEGAILAVGAVTEKAVVVDGRVEVGLRCRLTLSCDHRVVDGATGAKFLQSLKQIIENPVYLAF
ncbi:MAG: dihydrolipoamide acetyltransferase family protein [Acidobacteriota bacterium]|nr:dihydrolipoamide acetyltransferase family protein [Acidobacteriota bacterium]